MVDIVSHSDRLVLYACMFECQVWWFVVYHCQGPRWYVRSRIDGGVDGGASQDSSLSH